MPIERELLSYASNTGQITTEANAAKQTAARVFDAGKGDTERALAGFGATLTPQQKAAHDRMRLINRNGAQIVAGNTAREATDNRLDKLSTNLMNIGRGVQGAGLGGVNTAADLENRRNNAALQANAAQNAAGYSALGTGIGIAGSAMLAWSDRNLKENIRPRDDQQDMDDVRSFENFEWDYKPGQSGWREEKGHIGGMAQDMPESFSDGKQIDIGDAVMVAFGALRNMDKRLQRIEQALLDRGNRE